MTAIQVDHVKKAYGTVQALADVSFHVNSGESFGLLGPNGAGKSTLIRIISTLESPTAGEVLVSGHSAAKDAHRVRQKIGVALQETGLDPLMTGREILLLTARLFGSTAHQARNRADFLMERFQLTDVAGRHVGTYSGGMRRRLDLAVALAHEPDIVILDEPTTGLDPTNRLALWDLLRSLSQDDHKTLLMTTQYLEEADALCDRVLFIDHGHIVAEGTPRDLKREMGYSVIRFSAAGTAPDWLAAYLIGHRFDCELDGASIEIYSANPEEDVFRLGELMKAERLTMQNLEVRPPSLDDVFLHLTSGENTKGAANL